MNPYDAALPSQLHELVDQANGWSVIDVVPIGQGMGVFSSVWRLQVRGKGTPGHVVAKLPIDGPNGDAARASGAYDRELLAYRTILPSLTRPPLTPRLHASLDDGSLLLDDLTDRRFVDQLLGLGIDDVLATVDSLHGLHHQFGSDGASLASLEVRRSAPSNFDPQQLRTGLDVISGLVNTEQHRSLADLLDNRDALVEEFDQLPPTLCHGDPRADNLAFEPSGAAILFDWQQTAIQHGEADLAWLAATSVDAERRRHVDRAIVGRYAQLAGQSFEDVHHRYRLGFLLPGLAVLLLAQRTGSSGRMASLVTTSIERISRAVAELDVVGAVRG